jgi:antitoxin component of RelBE/YafQ-DinJ toxin-antitoxin module
MKTLQIRLTDDLREQADSVLEDMGLAGTMQSEALVDKNGSGLVTEIPTAMQ